MIPTDTDGLLRDAGGARPASDVDALIERRPKMVDDAYVMEWVGEAAAALVQLRDSEALVRGKIVEQMIKIEWLERMKQNYYDEAVKGWSKCRAAEAEVARLTTKCKYGDPMCPCQDGDACHYEGDNPMTPPPIAALKARIANYQASRDWAIDTLAKALRVEADKTRAVEYYSRLAAERIAALEAERDIANARADTHLADAYSMRDQRDALAKDAERYRWLRGHMFFTKREWGTYAEFPESMIFAVPVSAENKKQNDAIDAAIDAAKEKP